jgi:50S ribosomal protein L16 3-hydroxylase
VLDRAKRTKRTRTSIRASASPTELGALFGAVPPFLDQNWPGKPRVFHHQEHLSPEIWHLPDLQSLDQALNIAVPATIFANLPDRHEEYNQVQLVSAADVRKAFACKMSISMEPEMGKLTELLFWLRSIQRELGLAQQTYGRCNIYASPNGGRTGCHYDQNINFVCQITGEKTWDLAPNTHITNPVTRHTIGTSADRSTAAYAKRSLPRSIPQKGRIRVVLKPGSVLFVPRGYWHQTTAKGESISLNFTYDQPSWAQVVSTAICHRLMKDEKWRGVAYGLRQEGPLRERAEAELETLLRRCGEALGKVCFDELV